MKTNKILLAATPASIAIAALLLSSRSVTADSLFVGYACVLTLVAVLALEYRVSWKRLFDR